MQKKGRRIIKSASSLILAAAVLFTMYGTSVLADTAGNVVRAGEVPKNPIHHCTKKNDGSDYTDWSYVYFGSYPQSEVTDSALMAAIIGASYDANGDA